MVFSWLTSIRCNAGYEEAVKMLIFRVAVIYLSLSILTTEHDAAETEYMNSLFERDGVLVEDLGDIMIMSGIWTTFITIDVPRPLNVKVWVDNIRNIIHADDGPWLSGDIDLWERRLERIMNISVSSDLYLHVTHNHRRKRGLIDFVGHVGHSLFGLAPVDDINKIYAYVSKAKLAMKDLWHDQKKLVSVYTNSEALITENKKRIDQIELTVGEVLHKLTKDVGWIYHLGTTVGRLNASRFIDGSINSIEMTVDDYARSVMNFHKQIVQLEHGFLTEDILPPHLLETIRQEMQTRQMRPPSALWCYSNLRINVLWERERDNGIVFSIYIPALSSETYKHYGIHYFPVLFDGKSLR